jgi:hypothetical protein
MKLARPFVRLPYRFDVDRLTTELAQFEESAWMQHPSRMHGNSAIPLVSVNGEDNDEFSGPMCETPHLHRCEYIRQIMAQFDEVIARSRLMRLAPGSEVSAHVDFNYHWYNRVRIHIPITTNPEVSFYCGDDRVHMQAGECWIFDSWRRHRVSNESDQMRVHLVIDTTGSGKFWRLVHQMEALNNDQVEPQLVAYSQGKSVTVRTEKYNVSPVMAPGEMEAMINELIDDFSANPNNQPELIKHYRLLLESLAKDWRAVWLECGWEHSALPRYEALLSRTVRQLHPEKRALTSSSNDVGVNPIVVQRIIRAALFRDERQRFIHESDN